MPPKSRGRADKGKASAGSSKLKGPKKKGHVARQNELTQHAVVDDDIGQMANLFELIESPWAQDTPDVPGLVPEEEDIDDIEDAIDEDAEIDPSLVVDKAWELFPGWRPGMEDEFRTFQDEAYGATGVGKEKHGKIRRGRADMPLSAEVRALLGQSNDHYVRQETDEAIRCLQQVIQIDANVHKAWNTLGLIYTELGDNAKALQAYLVAAHLQPKNPDLWKKNAYLCGAVGDKKQQIYCLSQAIKADNTDLDAIWDRSKLYGDVAQYKRAIDGFKGLLEQLPYDMNVLKELADVYNKQGQVSEAVALFESAFRHYRQGSPDDTEGSFGFTELMFMADLYINERRYNTAIDAMRKGIRWLQGRGLASEWDRLADDREFDVDPSRCKKDKDAADLPPGNDFPIDLRVALGICRLKLHQADEAKRHFAVAYKHHGGTYKDLFLKIGSAFLEEEMYEDAVSVFLKVDEDGEFETETVKAMAQCYRHLNDSENAIKCYQLIIENEPADFRTMLALAEVYEDTNEEAKAMELVRRVIAAQYKSASHGGLHLTETDEEMLLGGSQVQAVMRSLDAADDKTRKRSVSKRTPYDPHQERAKEEETRLIFFKVNQLKPRVLAGDEQAKIEYLREARSLVEDFMSIRSLFPHDRKKHFTGVRQYVRKTANLDAEAAEMAGRLQRTMDNAQQGLEVAVRDQQEAQYLRTVLIEDWLDALWIYSWIDASQDKEGGTRAVNLLKHLADSAVVYNSGPRTNTNHLVIAACAAINNDVQSLAQVARNICHLYQFRSSGYQLFNALLSQGSEHLTEYQDGRHQKYIRRQQREMVEALEPSASSARERVISSYRRRSRSDSIDSAEESMTTESIREATAFAPTKKNVDMYDLQGWNSHLSMLYGNIMMAARSHPLALTHYLRAYAAAPKDPLVCFSVGSAYIHRAMMRNSEDRQYQIMQGFTFLFRYFDLRKRNQEAHYNLGRAFHQLSLFHHAVTYYEKVIKMSEQGGIDDDEDLVREAAFNLFQIYVTSSNVTLADDIMTKYLCV